jgi:hypothetical protein
MSWKNKLLLSLSLFLTGHITAMCQISGIINTYTKVTAVNYLCNFITVNSPTGFAAGDKVLLIQMQGASITQTNTVNFGDITAIGDAGNYEFGVIDHFSGNDVYFSKTLLRTYTPSGSVQMISVPQYAAVSIDGELTAKAWDGNTGGVIVLESSDVVTLNANINVSEQGFRGGDKSATGGGCFSSSNGTYTYSYPTVEAGKKGEGIAAFIAGKESGRAKQANGGGGANSHNTGGGGGGNYGAGGRGGDKKTTGCSIADSPFGYGSVGLNSTYYNNTSNKIFMGGGGGGGQQNNGLSYNAGNGGGIIIIKAGTLNTNGFSIKSNGGSVASHYNPADPLNTDNGDGNSGGGAGGSILLDVPNYTGATALEVIGGNGGNTGYLNFDYGPGGGGGGGILWSSIPIGALLSANLSGGTAGISGRPKVLPSDPTYGSGGPWGATNGTAGAILNSLTILQSSSSSSCALPVELLNFSAKALGKYQVLLNWSTATELNNDFFSIERSLDGIHFYPLAKVAGYGNSHKVTSYNYTDEVSVYDILYYRLKQTDIDGRTVDLGIRKVYPEFEKIADVSVYPNPCKDILYIPLLSSQKEAIQHLVFVNSIGETIDAKWEETETTISIHTDVLPAGLYSLIVYTRDLNQIIKVLKEQ